MTRRLAHARRPRAGRSALALLIVPLALAGCATAKPPPVVEWPRPPETPRVRWVKSFATEEDLAGAMRKFGRMFVPADPDLSMDQPTGVALSPDDKILYVSSNGLGRVIALDRATGKMSKVAKTPGKKPKMPFGVATDADGNLYITDHMDSLVYVYGPGGNEFLRVFGGGKLSRPSGIAIDRRRQVVYVTSGSSITSEQHQVDAFTLKGEHLRTMGARGGEPGSFNFPNNLAVGADGTLYVVDMLNFRVQVFDPDGQLTGMFGRPGGGGQPGSFNKAKGIALDGFGNLYVSDSEEALVQIFNGKFQPLMAFGGRASAPGFMLIPNAMAIDSKNTIFVADLGGRCVHEYQLINTTPADSYLPPPGEEKKKKDAADKANAPAAKPGDSGTAPK